MMILRIILVLVRMFRFSAAIFFLSFMIFLSACKDCRCDDHHTLRDSIAQEYFTQRDENGIYRVTMKDYRLFKAFYRNDTGYLHSYQEMQQEEKKQDSIVRATEVIMPRPESLKATPGKEGFKFLYWNACNGKHLLTMLTISRASDTVTLSFVQYMEHGRQLVRGKEDSKILFSKDWYDFMDQVDRYEFWDLRPVIHNSCFPYSESVNIEWYDNSRHEKYSISRMDPHKWAVFDLFILLLKKGNWYEAFKNEFAVNVKQR